MHGYYLYYNIFIITIFIITMFFSLQWKLLFLHSSFFYCAFSVFSMFHHIIFVWPNSELPKIFAALHHTLEWLLSQGLFKTNKQLVKNVQKRRTSWQFYKWKRKVESEITQKSRKWQSKPAGTSCLHLGALTIKTFDLALSTYTENKHCFSQLQEHHK